MQKTLRSNSSSSFTQISFSNLLTKEGIHPCLVAQKYEVLLLSTPRALQRKKAVSQPALRCTPREASPNVANQPDTSSCQNRSCVSQQLLLGTSLPVAETAQPPPVARGEGKGSIHTGPFGQPCHAAVPQPQPCIPGVASLLWGGTAEMHNASCKALLRD